MEHLSVSRQHAQLTTDGRGGLMVTDLGSAHGTNLDGVWMKARAPRALKAGSVLRLGASSRELRLVRLPGPAADAGARAVVAAAAPPPGG